MTSKKQKAQQEKFKKARKKVIADGHKPFTKSFGKAMKKELAK